ncbi:MAG: glycosyltransferase [SAR324 cluster bacterium]|nr:glycosyltransferase [SAR324 cluster bacterium]
MTLEKPTILVMAEYYLPGYEGGGIIRAVSSLVEKLGDEFQFKIITRDRDINSTVPYSTVSIDSWNSIGKAEVLYLSPKKRSLQHIQYLLRKTSYELLYLNGLFDRTFSIFPLLLRRIGSIPKRPVIIAPRGVLLAGSIGSKAFKKRIYLFFSKKIGLYHNLIWQASSNAEEKSIQLFFNASQQICIAPDLPPFASENSYFSRKKQSGKLKILFFSRIAPVKNLHGALEVLQHSKGKIQFNIYGPVDDHNYWEHCQKKFCLLPKNVEVQYLGGVSYAGVPEMMKGHHLLFLPTLSENFGYVMLEAFINGLPVLISDQTPWCELETKNAGWDISLENSSQFCSIIQECVDMKQQEYERWAKGAWQYGKDHIQSETNLQKNRLVFKKAFLTSQSRNQCISLA